MSRISKFLSIVLTTFIIGDLHAEDSKAVQVVLPETVLFNEHIRPILSNSCFHCHGADEKSRKAKLRLDQSESAYAKRKSGTTIVPGKPQESLLIKLINTKDQDDIMPPSDSLHSLSEREKLLLKKWISQGGSYQKHWAFTKIEKPQTPATNNKGWSQHPVDQFVLAKLEAKGKNYSKRADRTTIFRRLNLDLTGLPPSTEALSEFLKDTSKNAYAKAVDRLLASQAYAEHRTRYWLDAVRYSDTHGLHFDNYREIWPYRDYVLNAFKKNMPFDQFTTEQLAGDLLKEPTQDQIVASGYNRLHLTTNEGGVIAEEVYVTNVNDQITSLGTVFLGLTTGCAVCHDHKFDPLTQREYYQFFSYFNSLKTSVLDGNGKNPRPFIKVIHEKQKLKLAEHNKTIDVLTAREKLLRPQVNKEVLEWVKKQRADMTKSWPVPDYVDPVPGAELAIDFNYHSQDRVHRSVKTIIPGSGVLTYELNKNLIGAKFNGREQVQVKNKNLKFAKDQPFTLMLNVKMRGNNSDTSIISQKNNDKKLTGFDLRLKGSRSLVIRLVHDLKSNGITVSADQVIKRNTLQKLIISYDGSGKAAGFKLFIDGKATKLFTDQDNLSKETLSSSDFYIGGGLQDKKFTGMIEELRVYKRLLNTKEVSVLSKPSVSTSHFGLLASLKAVTEKSTKPWKAVAGDLIVSDKITGDKLPKSVSQHFLKSYHSEGKRLLAELKKAQDDLKKLTRSFPTTMVSEEMPKPKQAYILLRGAYDKKGPEVQRQTPAFLPPFKKDWPQNRLGLAKWLTDPSHPLLARVTVNRFWQQIFGVGLCRTSEDFGSQGEYPSHPELLNYLSASFIESGWDVNKIIKLMVTSETYKQSSLASREDYINDPQNRLLSRGSRYRLDAEVIRDQNLFLSGLLNSQYGGPSVKPPQPSGLWEAVAFSSSNTGKFKASTGDQVYKRSVYTFWKRTSPPPQMTILDAPSRENCSVRRERTNTPMAALMLMNEKQNVEISITLARLALSYKNLDNEARLQKVFKKMFTRQLTKSETKSLLQALTLFKDEYKKHPKDAEKLFKNPKEEHVLEKAAWFLLMNSLINLDELITRQ